jgi:hypothetical protein
LPLYLPLCCVEAKLDFAFTQYNYPTKYQGNFFRIFQQFFSIVSPKTPRKRIRKKHFFWRSLCTLFGYGRKRPVGTYRVRVANFLNIANFDPVFLHNTHILSVCRFVGMFVILFYLSCLSVCLSVCLSYVQYCRYVQYV